ncbi:winged helix-turn-helix domain-containing protein [Acidovorax sp.]|uniref:winged helix-turn-helix domain-containing protein n=1 Tax=Acidovorax sp. TaxID=1872122 RepID=UPI002ACD26B4|nr:winged helix-turn-helix domain-containing protein [Acidovorax sp.]MDZ7865965.1 winged helix-turn-helix domain-containing protein [Acidovorax sp.]
MMNARILPRSVLVIDGENLARQITATFLSQNGFSVFQSAKPSLAKDCLCRAKPDLIVVNWSFAQASPEAFIESLRTSLAHPHTPVIAIDQGAGEQQAIEALEAGADDFLVRPFSPALLLARMMAVLRRRAPEISDREVTVSALTLNPARHEVTCLVGHREVRIEIGPTEFRMLHFLMSKPEVAHTRLEIRNRVWGEDQAIDERTIDAHIKRLRTALAPTGMDSMIQTVRLVGYRLSRKPLTSDLTDAGILPRPPAPVPRATSRRPFIFAAQ